MDYPEAVRYLLSFADFERSGRFQDRPDVAPMLALLLRLGDPHLGRTTVHIAGSKGKGSVAAMVEAILRAAGYRTGLYTSPHLHSYCERIRIDGKPIAEEDFASLVGKKLRPAVEAEHERLGARQFVTFDLLTALGFLAFREHRVRIQVIEVGLGGRVDSTNVFEEELASIEIAKELAVITPISLEHTAILGTTVAQIAGEKAAIITQDCTVVMAPQPYEEASGVVRGFAEAVSARLVIDVRQSYEWEDDLRGDRTSTKSQSIEIRGPARRIAALLPLLGEHQIENAATAVACVDALARYGIGISDYDVTRGLECVDWPGRMEVLRQQPLLVADGAHNRDSARRLGESLIRYFSAERVIFIVGANADKDTAGLAQELAPLAERVFAVQAEHPRAMPPKRIAEAFAALGIEAEVVDNVGAAIDKALAESGSGGLICVTGSLFVAAEAREHLGLGQKDRL